MGNAPSDTDIDSMISCSTVDLRLSGGMGQIQYEMEKRTDTYNGREGRRSSVAISGEMGTADRAGCDTIVTAEYLLRGNSSTLLSRSCIHR